MKLGLRFVSTATALGILGFGAMAFAALARSGNAQVVFRAAGPGGLEIRGTTQDLDVSETEGGIVVKVPLANVKTGIELRDKHMRDKYLEVQKYPAAILTVPRNGLKLATAGQPATSDVPCTLTLHGVTRPVVVHYDTKHDGRALEVAGKVHVNMTEFGINVPSYLGVTVKPDVDVTANFLVQGI